MTASRCCRRARCEAMTRDHLTAAQRASATLFLGEHGGWGYGMAAPGPTRAGPPEPSGYGWNGGTGTVWTTTPTTGSRASCCRRGR